MFFFLFSLNYKDYKDTSKGINFSKNICNADIGANGHLENI